MSALGSLDSNSTLFVCIDIQAKLLPIMAHKAQVVRHSNILLESSQILNVPLLITEQYPKGLGSTDTAIKVPTNATIMEKTTFSIFKDSAIRAHIMQRSYKHIVLFGIESHICVLQSAFDALDLGLNTIIVADSLSARSEANHTLALEAFRARGIALLPTESVLFMLVKDAKSANFKAISALIK